MIDKRGAISEDVRNAITRVLWENLRGQGFHTAHIRADVDHDGDPVLFIEAIFRLVPEPIDPAITVGITGQLRDALEKIGEGRFPHVRYSFDDDQIIASQRKRKRA